MTYIKENIITKLQKLYSPSRSPRAGSKLPTLFVKKPLCTGDLSLACKILKGLHYLLQDQHIMELTQCTSGDP